MQYVEPYADKEIEFVDFSNRNDGRGAEEWLDLRNRKPIPLADGISMNLVGNQVTQYYMALTNDTWSESDQVYSYMEYIDVEQQYADSERYRKDRAYWLDKFQSLPELTVLKPYNPLASSTVAARKRVTISADFYRALTAFCRENKIGVFTFSYPPFIFTCTK